MGVRADTFQGLAETVVSRRSCTDALAMLSEQLGCSVAEAAGMWFEHRIPLETMEEFGSRVGVYDPAWSEPELFTIEQVRTVAWEMAHGRPVPLGGVLVHLCLTPTCFRPDHAALMVPRDHEERT